MAGTSARGGRPKPPPGLKTHGARLWRNVVDEFELRFDEEILLEHACRELDLIHRIDTTIGRGGLITSGSMGQDVANPLLAEVRLHRTTFVRLMRDLAFLADEPAGKGDEKGSVSARELANRRWHRRGA